METHATNEKELTHVVQIFQKSPAITEVPFSTTSAIAHSQAGDSSFKTFSTSFNYEELEITKEKDHVEFLRKLMSNQSISSIGKSPSSLIVLGCGISDDPLTLLVQQLKAKVFEAYLSKTIEEDPFVVFELRDLLKQLSGQDFPNLTICFILKFESFLDQITPNIAGISTCL